MSDDVLKTDLVHPDPEVLKSILDGSAKEADAAATGAHALKSDSLTGEVIEGKYKILEKLSAGGMGVVYRGEHSLMNREVAIKVLHAHLVENEESLKRFQHEAQIASKLTHPNAVMIYDFGVFRGLPYLVMELIEGITLKDAIKKDGALPVERVHRIISQAIAAISEAHELGIVHRDLKPDNIMLTKGEKGDEWVEVVDFGIAKILKQQRDPGLAELTQAGMFYGTPKYASPEQVLGKELDARSDIYALGVILYEALSGEVPFDAQSMMATLLKHINEPPRSIRKLKPSLGIPKDVDNVILKALAKDPEARYQTARALLEDLEGAIGISATQPMKNQKSVSPFTIGFLMAAVFAVVVLVVTQFHEELGLPALGKKKVAVTSAEPSASDSRASTSQKASPLTDSTTETSKDSSPSVTIGSKSRNSARALLSLAEGAGTLVQEGPQLVGMIQMMAMGAMPGAMLGGPSMGDLSGDMGNMPSDFPSDSTASNSASEANSFDTSTQETQGNIEASNQDTGAQEATDQTETTTASNSDNSNGSDESKNLAQSNTAEDSQGNSGNQRDKQLAALQAMNKAEDPAELFQEGDVLYRKKMYSAAAAKLERAVELRPNHMRSRLSLGVVYQRLGRFNDALTQFKAARRIDDGYAPVHFNLACLYSVMGDTEQSLDSLETMVTLSPRSRSWAKNEPDLENVRNSPRFRQIIH